MEIESFWKGIKPFKKTEKGSNGCINYGYWKKKGKESNKQRNHKKQAYRQIRQYGFDLSETWSLDYTIQRWLSDTFGGFFRICGPSKDWYEVNLEGNYVDFWEHKDDKDYVHNSHLWENARYESFKNHLQDFLDNANNEEKKLIANFCSPRLRVLAKIIHGWPADDEFKNFEDWQKEIYNMADKLDKGTYSPYFITYFFSLWD